MTKIAFASDHAGYDLKLKIIEYVRSLGYDVEDFGTYSSESCDYPDFAHPAARVRRGSENAVHTDSIGSG